MQLRNPSWQRQFLAQPLAARRAFAAQARAQSAKHTGTMDAAIMGVTPSAVEQALAALPKDRDSLTRGGVFSNEWMHAYLELKMDEVNKVRMTTHPVEFDLYYSC